MNARRHPVERFAGPSRRGASSRPLATVPAGPRGPRHDPEVEDGALGPGLTLATAAAMLGFTAAAAVLVQLLA